MFLVQCSTQWSGEGCQLPVGFQGISIGLQLARPRDLLDQTFLDFSPFSECTDPSQPAKLSFQELPVPSLALSKQKSPMTILLSQLPKAGGAMIPMQQEILSRIFNTGLHIGGSLYLTYTTVLTCLSSRKQRAPQFCG